MDKKKGSNNEEKKAKGIYISHSGTLTNEEKTALERLLQIDKDSQKQLKSLSKKLRQWTNLRIEDLTVQDILELKRKIDENDLEKSKTPKIWELLINWLACDDQEGIVLDLEDMVDDLKTFGASKLKIFFKVSVHLLPLLPKLLFGEIPITVKKRRE